VGQAILPAAGFQPAWDLLESRSTGSLARLTIPTQMRILIQAVL
jgi:hypothetical protein